jgi:ribosome-binding factor A
MESTRQLKVAKLLQKELGIYLQRNSLTYLNTLLSVTVVRISPDLSFAKVFVSVFPPEKREEVLNVLNETKSHVRFELGKKVKNQLRIVPELAFHIDDSLDYAERIDKLL